MCSPPAVHELQGFTSNTVIDPQSSEQLLLLLLLLLQTCKAQPGAAGPHTWHTWHTWH